LEDGLGQPLLIEAKEGQEQNGEDDDDNDEDPEDSHKPATSLVDAYSLLTPSVKVPFLPFQMFLLTCPLQQGFQIPALLS
jgi:hypothetical protein